MAIQTTYSHSIDILSWNPRSSDTSETENSTTLVTNSSGFTVYWTQGGSSGSLANNGTMYCVQGPTNKKWDFSESSGGAARVTLTVTSSGGNSPQPK